jgi:hypothetical protein
MTTVLTSIARFELMPATPSLPRMAVAPAKNADPRENHSQAGSAFVLSLRVLDPRAPRARQDTHALTCFKAFRPTLDYGDRRSAV